MSSHPPLPSGIRLVREFAGVHEYRLENGLQVLLNVDAVTPAPISVSLVYHVGSKHENYGETGIAHVLEHMVFKQTDCDQCNVYSELSKKAIDKGAETDFEGTRYYARFISDQAGLGHFAWFVAWLAQTMNQQSFIAAHRLDTEKTVVRNENEMDTDDDARALDAEVMAAMFKWHNYGNDVGGAASDVAHLDVVRLRSFYQRYYRPDNACLIVTGQIDLARLFDLIATYFSPIVRPNEPLTVLPTIEPLQVGERDVVLHRPDADPMLLLAYRGPAITHPDAAVIWLLAVIWQQRVQRALQDVAISCEVQVMPLVHSYIMTCQLVLTSVTTYEKSYRALLEQFETALPITQRELETARIVLLDSTIDGDKLARWVRMWGDWRFYFWDQARIRDALLLEVQAVADMLFQAHHRTMGTLLPADEIPSTWRLAPDVDLDGLADPAASSTPSPSAQRGISQVDLDTGAQCFTLDNGMRVALFTRSGRGCAYFRFNFSDTGLANQYLLPYLFEELLYQYVVPAMSDLTLEVAVGLMRVDITLQAQQPSLLEDAIGLLCRKLARAMPLRLDQCDHLFSALRLRLANDKTRTIVSYGVVDEFSYPYAAEHSLYYPSRANFVAAVSSVDLKDLQLLYPSIQNMLATSQVQLGVLGNVNGADLQQALRDGCREWTTAQPYRPIPAGDQVSVHQGKTQQTMPGWQNMQMTVNSYLPLNASHADYPALQMANLLLGDSFFSRLMMRIREKEGLSYSLHSRLLSVTWCPSLLWRLTINLAPQNRLRVEQCFDEELDRARREGFTAQELQDGQSYFASQRWYQAWKNQHTKETDPQKLAKTLAIGVDRDVDLLHYDRLAQLRLEEVNQALQRYLNPAHMYRHFIGNI